ncbi:PPC domain-containing protein, partial [Lysobacter sp. 2RAB21]
HVLGWSGITVATRITSTRLQRFDAAGSKVGPLVLLGRDPDGSAALAHTEAKVAIAGDGRVLAVWSRRSSFSDLYAQWNVYGREFRADGTPLGAEFRIDTAPASAVLYPDALDVVMSADGQYTVTWAEADGGQRRQWARRFSMEGGPALQTLSRGVPIAGLSGAVNTFRYFRFTVPPNTPSFSLTLSGGGDADMLVKYGEPPTLGSYDMSTAINGSYEGAMVNNPPAGDFYVGLFGYTAYSGVTLQADW